MSWVSEASLVNLLHRGGNQGFRHNPNNLLLGSQEIPTFRCPSDGGRKEWFSPTSAWVLPDETRGGLACGNDGTNCGAGNAFSRTDYRIRLERGPFHFGGSGTPAPEETFAATFAAVRDGVSNTVLVAELIAAEV